ncbi:small rna 2 -o-methyltransferase-like protein [Lasius niger]|uniref:Small rna 2-o-methyltransferase-like protein n=1 Tax=Lasius niger TaxID=67767 RepID=A0A0J7MN93_LASNI|nr:small rna 2 -o-methyltransferase-like protein [Lasius niger]
MNFGTILSSAALSTNMAAKSKSEEELQLWNEPIDLIFESSSDESDSSSDSESSSDDEEEEEDLQILNTVLVARGPRVPLPRQKNYVERVVPTFSPKFFKENFRYVLLFIK